MERVEIALVEPAADASACDWLAAYTRPRHEQRVAEFCLRRELQVFLPTHATWRYWSDRRKLIRSPLFPSYVFIRLAEGERRLAMEAPGMVGWVRGSGGAARVAPGELLAISRLLQAGLAFDPLAMAEIGDEVEITAGALRGCRGQLLRKEPGAIALMIAAINGGVRVNLPDSSWVRLYPRSVPARAQSA